MNKFRRRERFKTSDIAPGDILLIEDSVALSLVLRRELERATGLPVVVCKNLKSAAMQLSTQRFTVALTGLNLPDAPYGEILKLLSRHDVPTVVFSATFVEEISSNYAARKLADYVLNDGKAALEKAVAAVSRVISNKAISVLVVDDARSVRSELVDFLSRQNFTLFEAKSGREALLLLAKEQAIELVVTDYHMPDMDGYELTKSIRSAHGADRIRIIGVSSSSDRRLSAFFLRAGASDFIHRPFIPEELQCRINNNVEILFHFNRLRQLAERDPLTNMLNRRAFLDEAESYLQAAEGGHTSGAIAIMDIDHFKKVNDRFGHEMGDAVLKAVAMLLMEDARRHDFVTARLGGEEFAFVFPNISIDAASKLCAEILDRIRLQQVSTERYTCLVTASIGLTAFAAGETLDNQLNAADQLLYLAKQRGRDRVCVDAEFDPTGA